MIILTPELAGMRAEARRVYPDATWLPGDEPPIGTKVRFRDGRLGEVRGVYTGAETSLHHWWFVRDYVLGRDAIEYPPSLQKA